MKAIYHHEVKNIAGQDLGAHVNLTQVVAVGPIENCQFEVTLALAQNKGASVKLYALTSQDREKFVAAWEAFSDQEGGKI